MGAIEEIAVTAERRNSADGEYTVRNGIAICNRCGKPRQVVKELLGVKRLLWVNCECMQETESGEDLQRIEKLQKHGGVDPECTFDRAEKSSVILTCKRYADAWDKACSLKAGLILWGDVGTGKTFAAHCIANELIRKRDLPVFITSLSRVINSGFDKTDVLTRIRETPLVVFDDLGAERANPYALEQVFLLVDERYRAKKPLIITTNLSIDEIRYPNDIERKRIYDRILERCVPLLFEGSSRREEEAAERLKFMQDLLND